MTKRNKKLLGIVLLSSTLLCANVVVAVADEYQSRKVAVLGTSSVYEDVSYISHVFKDEGKYQLSLVGSKSDKAGRMVYYRTYARYIKDNKYEYSNTLSKGYVTNAIPVKKGSNYFKDAERYTIYVEAEDGRTYYTSVYK